MKEDSLNESYNVHMVCIQPFSMYGIVNVAASPSLTLRSTPEHGMHVHVQRSKRGQSKIDASPIFIRISESGSTRCYFYKASVIRVQADHHRLNLVSRNGPHSAARFLMQLRPFFQPRKKLSRAFEVKCVVQ